MSGSSSLNTDRVTWWEAALMIRGQTDVDQRNIRSVWVWSFVFAIGCSAALIALEQLPLAGPVAWLLAAVPGALCIQLARVCLRFIREADEFMRKIQLEGLAIGFAAGSVFCIGYFGFEQIGAPTLPMLVAAVPFGFGWAIGSFIVAYRHR